MTDLDQNDGAAQCPAEICNTHGISLENAREHTRQQSKDGAYQSHPAAGPAHCTGERNKVRAHGVGCGLQAFGLINRVHDLFYLSQGSGKTRRQMIRQKTESAMTQGAIPTSNQGTRRGTAPIGPVTGEATAPLGGKRATRQTCKTPGLSCNVVLAGVPRLVSKLHRQWACLATTLQALPFVVMKIKQCA